MLQHACQCRFSSVGSHHAADAAAVGSLSVRAILGFAADADFDATDMQCRRRAYHQKECSPQPTAGSRRSCSAVSDAYVFRSDGAIVVRASASQVGCREVLRSRNKRTSGNSMLSNSSATIRQAFRQDFVTIFASRYYQERLPNRGKPKKPMAAAESRSF